MTRLSPKMIAMNFDLSFLFRCFNVSPSNIVQWIPITGLQDVILFSRDLLSCRHFLSCYASSQSPVYLGSSQSAALQLSI